MQSPTLDIIIVQIKTREESVTPLKIFCDFDAVNGRLKPLDFFPSGPNFEVPVPICISELKEASNNNTLRAFLIQKST